MAVDEALLESAAEGGGCTWRFYTWWVPTLSLGYFQPYAQRAGHPASRDCSVVRRLSGGGAILHDQELTYSVAAPAGHPLATDAATAYRAVHAALVETLTALGIVTRLREQAANIAPADEPFLCFQREAAGDVLLGTYKIAGSAQRRRRGAISQHGSVLFRASAAAPELPGIEDLSGRKIDPIALREVWTTALSSRLDLTWEPGSLTLAERERARTLAAEKFATAAWNERR